MPDDTKNPIDIETQVRLQTSLQELELNAAAMSHSAASFSESQVDTLVAMLGEKGPRRISAVISATRDGKEVARSAIELVREDGGGT